MEQFHVAITLKVKHGKEEEFEEAIRDFARRSLHAPGTTGVHLIGPVPGTGDCDYGIMRSFKDEAASRDFYSSELFAEWREQSAHLVVGDPMYRKLHGLEAFFRETGQAPPPRWKMAIVTWLGVFPAVAFWSLVLSKLLVGLPWLAVVAVTNVVVVITLAWGIMPLLTRLLTPWLHASPIKSS